ncbi:hypothetical protein C8Q76DRAFT_739732 [Earliella scabrosa]|nr:hypothetical protein C8Q76DRAFT_739732 [Earliella scabrosa]
MSVPNPSFLAPLQDALSIVLSKPLSVVFVWALLLFMYGAPGAESRAWRTLSLTGLLSRSVYVSTEYQTYRYFKLYASDLPFSRHLVLALFILEALTIGLCILAECEHEAHEHPTVEPIDRWIVKFFTPLTVIALAVCQRIYAHCVHLVSLRHRLFVAIAILLVLAGLGLWTAAVAQGQAKTTVDGQYLDLYLYSSFGCILLAGLGLTGTLVGLLLSNAHGVQCTYSLAEILTVYSLNAGLLTSTFALLALVFSIVRPEHLPIVGTVTMCTKFIASVRLAVRIHLHHLQLHPRRSSQTNQCAGMQASIALHYSSSTDVPQSTGLLTRHALRMSESDNSSAFPVQAEEKKEPLIPV